MIGMIRRMAFTTEFTVTKGRLNMGARPVPSIITPTTNNPCQGENGGITGLTL